LSLDKDGRSVCITSVKAGCPHCNGSVSYKQGRGGLQGVGAKMPVPSSAPPPLRPGLVDWAEPPVQRGSCRHCPSLQFFFLSLFFSSPQTSFNLSSRCTRVKNYLKSLGIIPLPLVQRSCCFYCVRIPPIQITTVDPASTVVFCLLFPSVTYTACCIRSSSAQITSICSTSSSLCTLIFFLQTTTSQSSA
jgi:hypothetical protein